MPCLLSYLYAFFGEYGSYLMTLVAASLFLPHISRNLAYSSNNASFSDESHTRPTQHRKLHLFGASFPLPGWENLWLFQLFWPWFDFFVGFGLLCGEIRLCQLELFSVPCVLNSHWWLLALDSSTDWLLIGNLICCLSSTSDVERNTEQLG